MWHKQWCIGCSSWVLKFVPRFLSTLKPKKPKNHLKPKKPKTGQTPPPKKIKLRFFHPWLEPQLLEYIAILGLSFRTSPGKLPSHRLPSPLAFHPVTSCRWGGYLACRKNFLLPKEFRVQSPEIQNWGWKSLFWRNLGAKLKFWALIIFAFSYPLQLL